MPPADRSNGHPSSPPGASTTASEMGVRVRKVLAKCQKAGVPPEEVAALSVACKLMACSSDSSGGRWSLKAAKLPAAGALGLIGLWLLFWLSGAAQSQRVAATWLGWWGSEFQDEKCLVENPDWLQQTLRTPEDCSLCVGINDVDRIVKITPELFERNYAQTGRPVVIEDAMRNWTAPSVFSFQFLRQLYRDSPQQYNCQFFPYKTEFKLLSEFFNMSNERATGRPWYVGWSNCDDRVSRELRQHYSRPYFLPENSENKQLDWIFMGSAGYGAHMHVDNVGHVSWQAQLKGQKLWVLQPPPECLYKCSFLQTILKPGDIIVLDTNRWYHSTLIVSDDVSITIGAEFD